MNKFTDGCLAVIGMHHGRDNGHSIRTGLKSLDSISGMDTANCHDGQRHGMPDESQLPEGSRNRIPLRCARKKATETDIVGPLTLGTFGFLQGVRGDADQGSIAQHLPGALEGAVPLPQMQPVGPAGTCQLGIVIDDKDSPPFPTQSPQAERNGQPILLRVVFTAILEQAHTVLQGDLNPLEQIGYGLGNQVDTGDIFARHASTLSYSATL